MKNRNFKLELVYVTTITDEDDVTIQTTYDTITNYQNGQYITSYTYNEKVAEKEFGQTMFTFNSVLFVDGVRNPFIRFLSIDRKLRLTFDNRVVDFYITSITPSFSNNNVSYAYTCQDAFSYELSKICNSISISTDDEDITDWGGNTGPKQIQVLIQKVLQLAYSDWSINEKMFMYENNSFFKNTTDQSDIMTISYEQESITPYNAITEIAKNFDAILFIDYENKQLSFWQKELMSYKGLYLRPETNLSSFSYSNKGDNLYNILHVYGDEDADGNYVSIIPTTPNILLAMIPDLAEKVETGNIESMKDGKYHFYGNETDKYYLSKYTESFSADTSVKKVEGVTDININADGYLNIELNKYFDQIQEIWCKEVDSPNDKQIYDGSNVETNDWDIDGVQIIDNKILITSGGEPNPVYSSQLIFSVVYTYFDTKVSGDVEKVDNITYEDFWKTPSSDMPEKFAIAKAPYGKSYSEGDISKYFKQLQYVPSGTSILYDFDYWYDQGLLTQLEKQTIERMWSIDFRNINLQYNCYYPQYLKMKYRLDQLDDQLQELYAELAAEGELYASKEYDAEAYTSENAFASYCTQIKEPIDDNDLSKGYNTKKGLRIGYYNPIDNKTIILGKDVNNESIVIPDTNNIKELKKAHYKDGSDTEIDSYEFNCLYRTTNSDGKFLFKEVKFTMKASISIGDDSIWYIDEVEPKLVVNTPLYISWDEDTIETLFPTDSTTNKEINSAYFVNTADIQGQINDIILSDEYLSLQHAFNGSSWLSDRIAELNQLISEKTTSQRSLYSSLVDTYGTSWRDLDTNTLGVQSTIAYADLVQQYDDLAIYIGGYGTRTDSDGQLMTYKGRLDHELEVLQSLQNSANEIKYSASYDGIVQKITELTEDREEWWTNWYKSYGWISRESTFEDSDQIDWSGLYSVAWTQFQKIKQPTQTYSLNYLQSDWLEDSAVTVMVGDKIRLQHQHVKDVLDDNKIEIVISNNIQRCKNAFLTVLDENNNEQKIHFFNCKIVNDNHLILHNAALQEYWKDDDKQKPVVTKLVIDDVSYGASGYNRIVSIEPVYRNQAIDLRVSGITHDLRSDVYQLQVEDFTLYKTLVDRLLYLIK